jgi:ornithine cyclodeaminase/alanine dehydrogenase-like protein (mu-crystallin family)
MTVILTKSLIDRYLPVVEAIDVLRDGFRAPAAAQPSLRIHTDLPGPGTATCLMPGLLPDVPAYTVKVNAKFPGALPALRGVVCLHDLNSGELLALADSASVTAWRTGLAAAIGTHELADRASDTLGFVGAGAQARTTLAGLRLLRRWRRVVACDLHRSRAAALTADVVADARETAANADVVILATWARRPLLHRGDVRSGQHLTTLGADEPGKAELSAGILRDARVIVDDLDLVATTGALASAGLDAAAAAGTLADVLCGRLAAPDSSTDCRVSVYAPVGLPWQDLAVTWLLYQRAAGTGATVIDLLG